jgi:hypothetical protein
MGGCNFCRSPVVRVRLFIGLSGRSIAGYQTSAIELLTGIASLSNNHFGQGATDHRLTTQEVVTQAT